MVNNMIPCNLIESMTTFIIDLHFNSLVGDWENDEFNCFKLKNPSEWRSLGHE